MTDEHETLTAEQKNRAAVLQLIGELSVGRRFTVKAPVPYGTDATIRRAAAVHGFTIGIRRNYDGSRSYMIRAPRRNPAQ